MCVCVCGGGGGGGGGGGMYYEPLHKSKFSKHPRGLLIMQQLYVYVYTKSLSCIYCIVDVIIICTLVALFTSCISRPAGVHLADDSFQNLSSELSAILSLSNQHHSPHTHTHRFYHHVKQHAKSFEILYISSD